LNKSIPALIA